MDKAALIQAIQSLPEEGLPELEVFLNYLKFKYQFQTNLRRQTADQYPLRGTPLTYIEPTEPVALEDWSILQ
jgi:hypothetical protein